MYKNPNKLQHLRSSQRFLSREEPGSRPFRFCCCDEEEMAAEDALSPPFPISPQPKISIRKLRRQSPNGCNHTNSDFSLSKQSHRSNLPISKKNTQTHIGCPHCSAASPQPLLQTYPANITFQYSNSHRDGSHFNAKAYGSQKIITAPQPVQNPNRPLAKAIKPKQLDENIEKQFKTILGFGENGKEEYTYGEAFPINGDAPKVKSATQNNMPNFSFGQNQKEYFMSKYLNVKQEASVEKVPISSKENSKRSEMREIIQERMSKSSKSSGRVFVRGTFNKQNLNSLGRRDFMYKSESEISLESSQSLVLQTYQSIMRKKESFIREYQY